MLKIYLKERSDLASTSVVQTYFPLGIRVFRGLLFLAFAVCHSFQAALTLAHTFQLYQASFNSLNEHQLLPMLSPLPRIFLLPSSYGYHLHILQFCLNITSFADHLTEDRYLLLFSFSGRIYFLPKFIISFNYSYWTKCFFFFLLIYTLAFSDPYPSEM